MRRVNLKTWFFLSATLGLSLFLVACGDSSNGDGSDTGGAGSDLGGTGGDGSNSGCYDPDNDGYGPGCPLGDYDCLPFDPSGHPGAEEICGDGVDNNCNGLIDEGCPCMNGQVQSCYDGPPGTENVGICRSGYQICEQGAWSDCRGAIHPKGEVETECDGLDNNCDGRVDEGLVNACGTCGPTPVEICGDGLDNDCDGVIDNGCDCDGRISQPCYSGPPHTLGLGQCSGGTMDCLPDGTWGPCIGEVLPGEEICDGIDNNCDGRVDEGLRNACGECGGAEPLEICDGVDNNCDGRVDEGLLMACGFCPGEEGAEVCGDGFDNNCDGRVDEGCPCSGVEWCYPGPPETLNVGQCRAGHRSCDASGEFWGACEGYVLPSIEICDGIDNDCDGLIDVGPDGCSVCGSSAEICDGIDNNCDGFIDEGLRNSCGQCIEDAGEETLCDGRDDNCNGLIDEGLVNACGKCQESCFFEHWNQPEDWSEGTFNGVHPENIASGLRLGTALATWPDLWVTNNLDKTVTRIDTDTAEVLATYNVGLDPSHTAVDASGDLYVVNRAFNGQGTITKLRSQGCRGSECIAWTVNVGGMDDVPRGIAIDGNGMLWTGTFNGSRLYLLHPDDGEILGNWEIPVKVFGLAMDPQGVLWIATMTSAGVGAFDTTTQTWLGSWAASGCSTSYGIATDRRGNVWVGSYDCNALIRFDRSQLASGVVNAHAFTNSNVRQPRGVAVDADGMIYVASAGTNRFGKFNPYSSEWLWTVGTCAKPVAVAIARDGDIWVVCKDANETRRYNSEGGLVDTVATGRSPDPYSGMTGIQLQPVQTTTGWWRTTYDCGRAESDCEFDRVRLEVGLPAGTQVEVRARTRPANPDAPWSAWTLHDSANPAELRGRLPAGRYCQVEVRLSTDDPELTPIVTNVDLEWQRP